MTFECKCCEILQEQLDYERAEKKELLETLASLLKPQVIYQSDQEFKPTTPRFQIWSRRRADLEKADREAARLKINNPLAAEPDVIKPGYAGDIEQLEMELGITEES